jgi:glucokinase
MRRFTIGVDLGGTNLRAAAFNEQGILLDQTSAKTHLSDGPEAVVDDIVAAIVEMRNNHDDHDLIGVGVGVPGFIRLKEGIIVGSNNLATLEGFPMRDAIGRKLGIPVILENDANAAALGECWLGAGKDVDDLVLLTLGTGVGGGIISRGRVVHGTIGMAGELGHVTVYPDGNPCGCGNRGCLEKHASATAISAMAELIQLGRDLSAAEVHKLAQAGDRRALQVFDSVGHALGIALASLINIFNFPLYLLSGGPLPAWDFFAPAMMEEIETRSYTYRNSNTRVEKAVLGNLAGLYGAAYLPYQLKDTNS